MKIIKRYPNGTFNWVDLMTPDVESSKKFYTSLFGWSSEDSLWPKEMKKEGIMYSIQKLGDHPVAGIGSIINDSMPPNWASYIAVDNIEETVSKVKEYNGTVEVEPMNVEDHGRMAVIQDPTGAYLSLWQAGTLIGAHHCNSNSCMGWNDLGTTDLEKALKFYTDVFGWEYEIEEMNEDNEMKYYTIKNNGRSNGGIFQIPEFMGKDISSNWSTYFMVENYENAKQIVIDNGGEIMLENTQNEIGSMCMIKDPHGAVFWIMHSDRIDEIPDSWC